MNKIQHKVGITRQIKEWIQNINAHINESLQKLLNEKSLFL